MSFYYDLSFIQMKKLRLRQVIRRWDCSAAGVERRLGREPFPAPFLGKQDALPPQRPSLFSQHTSNRCTQEASGCKPASSSRSLADGVVRGEGPAGVCMLWACCLWVGTASHCQPRLITKSQLLESSAEPRGTRGQGRVRSSPGLLPRAAQCCLVPNREDMGEGVSTHLISEMELRLLF